MFHFLHSHGGSATGTATGTATRTIDAAWCWHVVMLRCWGCDVVNIWEVVGEGGNKFDQTKDLSENKFAQQDSKKHITRDDVRKSSVRGFVYISFRYTMKYSSSNTDSKVQCSFNLPTSLHEFDGFSSSFCRSSY